MSKKSININTTIDIKHNEMLERFNDIETNIIPKLKEENAQLIEDIKKYKTKKDVDIYMELKDKIINNKKTIKELKKEKDNYFIENSFYIFKYFEEKKKISSGDNNQNMNVLNTFFKIKSTNDDVNNNIASEKYFNSRTAYQNYWKNTNNEILNIKDLLYLLTFVNLVIKGNLYLKMKKVYLFVIIPNVVNLLPILLMVLNLLIKNLLMKFLIPLIFV